MTTAGDYIRERLAAEAAEAAGATRELGVIQEAHYGLCLDTGRVGLHLTVKILGGGFITFLNEDKASRLIRDAKCSDISKLRGEAVEVECRDSLYKVVCWR